MLFLPAGLRAVSGREFQFNLRFQRRACGLEDKANGLLDIVIQMGYPPLIGIPRSGLDIEPGQRPLQPTNVENLRRAGTVDRASVLAGNISNRLSAGR